MTRRTATPRTWTTTAMMSLVVIVMTSGTTTTTSSSQGGFAHGWPMQSPFRIASTLRGQSVLSSSSSSSPTACGWKPRTRVSAPSTKTKTSGSHSHRSVTRCGPATTSKPGLGSTVTRFVSSIEAPTTTTITSSTSKKREDEGDESSTILSNFPLAGSSSDSAPPDAEGSLRTLEMAMKAFSNSTMVDYTTGTVLEVLPNEEDDDHDHHRQQIGEQRVPSVRLVRPSRQEVEGGSPSSLSSSQDDDSGKPSNYKTPSYKDLLVFGSTSLLIWLSEPLLSLVDTTVVSLSSSGGSVLPLASLGPATTLMDSLLWMCLFLSITTTNLLSSGMARLTAATPDDGGLQSGQDVATMNTNGKKHVSPYRSLQETTSHVLGVAAVLGVLVTGIVVTAGPSWLSNLLSNASSGGGAGGAGAASSAAVMLKHALSYAWIRAAVAPFAVMGMVAQAILLATHNTRVPALSVAVASLVNIVGDLVLCPRMGSPVVGAAIATAMASTASSALLLRAVWKQMKTWKNQESQEEEQQYGSKEQSAQESVSKGSRRTRMNLRSEGEEPTSTTGAKSTTKSSSATASVPFVSLPDRRDRWKELLGVSGPLCFNMWAKIGCYSALTVAATQFGIVNLAAHNLLMRLFFLFGCVADALGQTAQNFLPSAAAAAKSTVTTDSNAEKPASPAYRTLLTRLSVLSGLAAIGIGQASRWLLQGGAASSLLTQDSAIRQVLHSQGPYLGLSLLLHPLIVLMESAVIANRQFSTLLRTYVVTLAVHGASLTWRTSRLAHVWQTLVLFQFCRLTCYTIPSIVRHMKSSSSEPEADRLKQIASVIAAPSQPKQKRSVAAVVGAALGPLTTGVAEVLFPRRKHPVVVLTIPPTKTRTASGGP